MTERLKNELNNSKTNQELAVAQVLDKKNIEIAEKTKDTGYHPTEFHSTARCSWNQFRFTSGKAGICCCHKR